MCDSDVLDLIEKRQLMYVEGTIVSLVVQGGADNLKQAQALLDRLVEKNEPTGQTTLEMNFDFGKAVDTQVVETLEVEDDMTPIVEHEIPKKRKKRKKNKGGTVVCGRCGRSGHNRKTCTYATHANGGYIKEEIPEGAERK